MKVQRGESECYDSSALLTGLSQQSRSRATHPRRGFKIFPEIVCLKKRLTFFPAEVIQLIDRRKTDIKF